MDIQLSPILDSDTTLSARVRAYEPALKEMMPRLARAFWDLREDDLKRSYLTLALSDPFGYAAANFVPVELESSEHMRGRFHELLGELVYSARRVRIPIRDAFASIQQIADLQQRLNAIPKIAEKKPKLYNRMQLSPENPRQFLITDFAIEVDGDVAEQVKEVIRNSGFNLRGDPLLDRHGIRDCVRQLVQAHLKDEQPKPRYAICFQLQDPVDLHLLEVADDAPGFNDGALGGVGFIAGSSLPGARSIVLYLASPEELRLAAERNPHHPAIHDLRNRLCWFVYPQDGEEAFYREFPELKGTNS